MFGSFFPFASDGKSQIQDRMVQKSGEKTNWHGAKPRRKSSDFNYQPQLVIAEFQPSINSTWRIFGPHLGYVVSFTRVNQTIYNHINPILRGLTITMVIHHLRPSWDDPPSMGVIPKVPALQHLPGGLYEGQLHRAFGKSRGNGNHHRNHHFVVLFHSSK